MLASESLKDKFAAFAQQRVESLPFSQYMALLVDQKIKILPPSPLVAVDELCHEDLIKVMRHCPLSDYFAWEEERLNKSTFSLERSRFLVARMLTRHSEFVNGLESVLERNADSERSVHQRSARGHPIVIADLVA